MRELHVDGSSVLEFLDEDTPILVSVDRPDDAEVSAPFFVFDADQQHNIAGPFDSYEQAKAVIDSILAEPGE
jgi:hypothetical protein